MFPLLTPDQFTLPSFQFELHSGGQSMNTKSLRANYLDVFAVFKSSSLWSSDEGPESHSPIQLTHEKKTLFAAHNSDTLYTACEYTEDTLLTPAKCAYSRRMHGFHSIHFLKISSAFQINRW